MIKAGIMGASGYMGGEVLRVLLDHPEVEIAWATSRSAGHIEEHHPNLYGTGIELIHPEDATPCDVVFLALPTDASIQTANSGRVSMGKNTAIGHWPKRLFMASLNYICRK